MSETLLLNGECVETMRGFGDGTVDAVVCDPPYHLTSIVERFGSATAAPVKVPEGGTGVYARATKGFMGQVWDGGDVAFRVETWREVLRVLKPGGYLLAFSGTRTYHRMTVAIEDAGFEIRDCLSWQYGSGFPKSLAVDKAIAKAGGTSPAETARWLREQREAAGLSRVEVAERVGCAEASVRDWEEGRARAEGKPVEFIVPSEDYRVRLEALFDYPEDTREVTGTSTDRRGDGTVYGVGLSGTLRGSGTTDAARRWAGWGTALKPAWEPIVVARRPLEGTVAANVLKHGTGALNIDGCRVAGPPSSGGSTSATTALGQGSGWNAHANRPTAIDRSMEAGRWPANVILSCPPDCDGDTHAPGCPCAALDAQSGVRTSGDPRRSDGTRAAAGVGWGMGEKATQGAIGDTGGASRYFNRLPIAEEDLVPFIYAAKASRSERNAGMPEGSTCTHPTVKPVSVMRHLTRLVVPPGGLVLDPFMGSGTTGIAAVREGFDFVGIEMNAEYLSIAEARIEHAKAKG